MSPRVWAGFRCRPPLCPYVQSPLLPIGSEALQAMTGHDAPTLSLIP